MNPSELVRELEEQLERVNQAIAALRRGAGQGRGLRGRRSAAWRRRISEGMRRKWAERKKGAA